MIKQSIIADITRRVAALLPDVAHTVDVSEPYAGAVSIAVDHPGGRVASVISIALVGNTRGVAATVAQMVRGAQE